MPAVDTAAGSWGGTGIIRYSRHWEEIMAHYENTSSQVSFGKDTTLTKSHLVISRTDPSLSCKTPKHESGMLVLLKDKRLPRPSPPLTKRDSRCSLFLLAGLPVLKKIKQNTYTNKTLSLTLLLKVQQYPGIPLKCGTLHWLSSLVFCDMEQTPNISEAAPRPNPTPAGVLPFPCAIKTSFSVKRTKTPRKKKILSRLVQGSSL